MRRLTTNLRTHWHTIRRADDGATLVFAAVILVAILALSAFAIDFGRMWEERRQLQNGADAAALAIAEDCARGLCDASYDEYATAEIYVDDNARDGLAWAQQVDLDLTNQTVTVYNATEDPGGDNKFDMLLAGIVGFDGFTVTAQATAQWGSPLAPAVIPITISECEWNRPAGEPPGGAGGGADVWDPDDINYTSEPYSEWLTLAFHTSSSTIHGYDNDCAAPAGQDTDGDDRLNGGFGHLDSDDNCLALMYDFTWVLDEDGNVVEVDGWMQADTGNGPDKDCKEGTLEDAILGETVFIPVFDDVWSKKDPDDPSEAPCDGGGADHKCYHISRFAAFHVVAYKLNSGGKKYTEWLDPPFDGGPKKKDGDWCDGPRTCLLGYFTTDVYHGIDDVIGGPDSGITVIRLTG